MIGNYVKSREPMHPGDPVVLVDGPYQGTPGVLLHFKSDPRWAEIKEWNDRVRSHPVIWLRRKGVA